MTASEGDVGVLSSLAIDQQDHIHMAYYAHEGVTTRTSPGELLRVVEVQTRNLVGTCPSWNQIGLEGVL